MSEAIESLELKRKELLGRLTRLGDFRRGNVSALRRKCGKKNCACAEPGHRLKVLEQVERAHNSRCLCRFVSLRAVAAISVNAHTVAQCCTCVRGGVGMNMSGSVQ